jgi:hypothetical protein
MGAGQGKPRVQGDGQQSPGADRFRVTGRLGVKANAGR